MLYDLHCKYFKRIIPSKSPNTINLWFYLTAESKNNNEQHILLSKNCSTYNEINDILLEIINKYNIMNFNI